MDLLGLLVAVIVIGLIFYLLWWLLGKIALPEPFNKVAMVILCLAAVVILISMLTGNLSFPALRLR
jgi:uncharacterized membrane protein